MKNIGDYIIYRRNVCKIVDVKKNHFNNMDYYVLVPIKDESLHIDVPVNNNLDYIKDLMTTEDIKILLDKIPSIPKMEDEKKLENKYKELLDDGTHESLIRIIKTTYLRNKARIDSKKKISEKDQYYFDIAEQYLYSEIAVVLDITYDEAKEYVVSKFNDIK